MSSHQAVPENGGDINLSWLTESLPNTLDKTLCLFETVFPLLEMRRKKVLKIERSQGRVLADSGNDKLVNAFA